MNTHRVGDDENVGVRCSFGDSLGEVADDRCVGVEEVCTLSTRFGDQCRIMSPTITGHARLARNTGRNEDNLGASQALPESLGRGLVTLNCALCVDVTDISGDTRCSTDIVAVARSSVLVSVRGFVGLLTERAR